MSNELTLITPLKERHALTHRALSILEKQNCEFKIILADGSLDAFHGYEKYNLDIEYFYNGYDENISNYMNKMKNAFDKVSTPLSMIFDNDDIVDLSGVRNGISFMSKNKDYSTYQNSVSTLEVHGEENAQIINTLYTNRSIKNEETWKRMYVSISSFNSFNYAIFRTPINRFFFNVLDKFNNNDYQLFQKSWCYISAILGKCERLQNQSYYYFIPGESIIQTGRSRVHKFGEWLDVQDSRGEYPWQKTFPQMVSLIGFLSESLNNGENNKYGIRRRFNNSFLGEVQRKNSKNMLVPIVLKTEPVLEKSYEYDNVIKDCILEEFGSKENILNFEEFEYDANEEASKESFVQWLNTL